MMLCMTNLQEIDRGVRKRSLKPRALKEEIEFGLSEEQPVRRKKESDSYWNIRKLTYDILKVHYRTPQLNLYLLEDYLNSRIPSSAFIKNSTYVAPRGSRMKFDTKKGMIEIDVHIPLDTSEFLAHFGL